MFGAMVVTTCVYALAYGAEYNFAEQAAEKGCASVITQRGQDECKREQQKKDDACNVSVDCDVDKQAKTIEKYNEAKTKLDRGEVNDADRDKLKDTIRDLKDELDKRKEGARRGASVADGCVTARQNVQKWFIETGIPLTERTRDEALQLRKQLLDKLADAQKKQSDAKSNRDAKPGDSSAQSDYARATENMRDAEKSLEQFNTKYGKDVERNASKLIEQYKAEKESHERPLAEAKNRFEKCKKLDDLSY